MYRSSAPCSLYELWSCLFVEKDGEEVTRYTGRDLFLPLCHDFLARQGCICYSCVLADWAKSGCCEADMKKGYLWINSC